MEASLPKKIKSSHGHGKGKKLDVLESDLPQPSEGEVLLKVAYSSINPVDIHAINGYFPVGKDTNDWVPGLEGSGTVVQVGDKVSSVKVGAKVVFMVSSTHRLSGAWSEYSIQKASDCVEMPQDFDLKFGASPIVNPLTAHGIYLEIKAKGFKAVVLTAAASVLCKMLIKILKIDGIKTISIISKAEQVAQLKEIGSDLVLNSTDADFKDQYKKAVETYQPSAIFDALCSDFSVELLRGLPKRGILYVYGMLEGPEINHITPDFFFQTYKTVTGFSLSDKLEQAGGAATFPDIKRLPELLKTHYQTNFLKEYGLHEINEAIEATQKNAGIGKVLINPHKH